ncbi:uncharacterized protein VTP21DRAFT_2296 [Calcarisporiella thermophila]|uniref:uncharacterized protein n=1 Tax=Calcarisporiella thermophila TaxID=911321 RepID=UPI003742E9F6
MPRSLLRMLTRFNMPSQKGKSVYYAVRSGRKPGIYSTWEECREQVDGYSGSRYKKFKILEEAKKFIEVAGNSQSNTTPAIEAPSRLLQSRDEIVKSINRNASPPPLFKKEIKEEFDCNSSMRNKKRRISRGAEKLRGMPDNLQSKPATHRENQSNLLQAPTDNIVSEKSRDRKKPAYQRESLALTSSSIPLISPFDTSPSPRQPTFRTVTDSYGQRWLFSSGDNQDSRQSIGDKPVNSPAIASPEVKHVKIKKSQLGMKNKYFPADEGEASWKGEESDMNGEMEMDYNADSVPPSSLESNSSSRDRRPLRSHSHKPSHPQLESGEDHSDANSASDRDHNQFVLPSKSEKPRRHRPNLRSIISSDEPPSDSSSVVVYTDGSTFRNGRIGARSGVGVWWGPGDPRNVSEPLCPGPQTNQRAEVYAVIRALEVCGNENMRLEIRTDSAYLINCMTRWFRKWDGNDWKTAGGKPVENQDLLQRLLYMLRNRPGPVEFRHVRGHAGVLGNEMADRLAVAGSNMNIYNITEHSPI